MYPGFIINVNLQRLALGTLLSPIQLSVIVMKVIRRMADEKEYYYDSDTEVDDFGLHAKFFTAFDGNEMGCKASDLDLAMDLTDQVQRMMEDNNLTEDALRRLAPGNE